MRRLDLRTKQLLLLSVVILAPIAIFAVLTARSTLAYLQDDIAIEHRRYADHVSRELNAWVDGTERLARLVSELPLARGQESIDIGMAMRRFLDRFPRFQRFRFLEPDGTLVVEEPPSRTPLPDYYAAEVGRVRDEGDLSFAVAHPFVSGTSPVLTLFCPSLDETGDLAYVLAADVSLADPRVTLLLGEGRGGLRALLVDASGLPLVGFDDPAAVAGLIAALPGSSAMSSRYPDIRLVRPADGIERVFTERTIARTRWRLILYQEEEIAFAPLHRFRGSVGTLLLVCALLTLFAGGAVAASLTRSIAQLAAAASGIARGDYDVALDIRSRDEVGDLARAFRAMADEVRRREGMIEALNRDLAGKVEARTNELRASKDHYMGIFSTLTEGLLVVDGEGRVAEHNPAAAALLRLPDAEIAGRALSELFARVGLSPDPCKADPPQEGLPLDAQFRLADGARVHALVSRVALPQGKTLWMLADVTGRKNLEAQLIQVEKLASLGQLMAGMAHEINNPLTAILGFASMLRAREKDPACAEHLERIVNASHRIGNIILNMRQFAQPSRRMSAPTDLNEVVKQAMRLLDNETSKHRALVEPDFARLPECLLDGNQMQQVVTNLVVNACHAIAQTGRPGVVRITTRREADDLVLRVRDNGTGIPASVLPRVFDPFFTTKSDWKGLGLGLSICHTIVGNHGGRIAVDSVEGEGTTVEVRIPVQTGDPDAPPVDIRTMREYARPADPSRLPERILLVDDEEDVRRLFDAFPGGRVTAVATGAEALAVAAERPFDLHIVDLRLEDMLGTELIERLRLAGAGGRHFVITGCAPDDELVRAARRLPGVAVIFKPFTVQDILFEIEREG